MENTKLASRGKTLIKQSVFIEIVDGQLELFSSPDLDVEGIAEILYKSLQMMSSILEAIDNVDDTVIH